MVKIMHFLKRTEGTTHEECIRHHREVHIPMVKASILGSGPTLLKKYVAYYFDEVPDMQYDLLVEQWYDDEGWETYQEFTKTPEYRKLQKDSDEHLLDRATKFLLKFETNEII